MCKNAENHTWDAFTVELLSSEVISTEGADAGLLLMVLPLPGRSSCRESAITAGLVLINLQKMHTTSEPTKVLPSAATEAMACPLS